MPLGGNHIEGHLIANGATHVDIEGRAWPLMHLARPNNCVKNCDRAGVGGRARHRVKKAGRRKSLTCRAERQASNSVTLGIQSVSAVPRCTGRPPRFRLAATRYAAAALVFRFGFGLDGRFRQLVIGRDKRLSECNRPALDNGRKRAKRDGGPSLGDGAAAVHNLKKAALLTYKASGQLVKCGLS